MARLLNKVEKTEFFKNQMKGHHFYSVKKYVNSYDIIVLNNGDFIEIDKPSIKRELYYNDETPAPSTALNSFIEYNLFMSGCDRFEKWKKENENYQKNGFCVGNLLHAIGVSKKQTFPDEPNHKSYRLYYDFDKMDDLYFLDEQENNEFIRCFEELNNAFIKRLKTYYKRYSDKIITVGYWANR